MNADQNAESVRHLAWCKGVLPPFSERDVHTRLCPHPAHVPDLVGTSEFAKILGVSKQRVPQLAAKHPRFPSPITRLACGPIWWKVDAEAFAQIERRVGQRVPIDGSGASS